MCKTSSLEKAICDFLPADKNQLLEAYFPHKYPLGTLDALDAMSISMQRYNLS